MAGACALSGAEWLESGGLLPAVGHPAARVCGLAADVEAGSGPVASDADRAQGRLIRLPSQWFPAAEPIDLRCGMDRLLMWVQRSGGAASGSMDYVFRNRAGQVTGARIKLLLIDCTGAWLSVRRLHAGRFHWPRTSDAKCELSSEQFAWLCAGVDWMRLSTSVVPEHTF